MYNLTKTTVFQSTHSLEEIQMWTRWYIITEKCLTNKNIKHHKTGKNEKEQMANTLCWWLINHKGLWL